MKIRKTLIKKNKKMTYITLIQKHNYYKTNNKPKQKDHHYDQVDHSKDAAAATSKVESL